MSWVCAWCWRWQADTDTCCRICGRDIEIDDPFRRKERG